MCLNLLNMFVFSLLLISLAIAEPKKLIKGDGYEAVLISAGKFTMGCTRKYRRDCGSHEKPKYNVKINRSFYIMKSEVMQGLYEKVVGSNPSEFKRCGRTCPVEGVTWYDSVKFANRLSEKEGLEKCYVITGLNIRWLKKLKCKGWRLPTEAEWEYAARGGKRFRFAGGNSLPEIAWYAKNAGEKTHPVCTKKSNSYHLCDMSGNVAEWVWDWSDMIKFAYKTETVEEILTDPKAYRIFRGGGFYCSGSQCNVAFRNADRPDEAGGPSLGFRLVRTAGDSSSQEVEKKQKEESVVVTKQSENNENPERDNKKKQEKIESAVAEKTAKKKEETQEKTPQKATGITKHMVDLILRRNSQIKSCFLRERSNSGGLPERVNIRFIVKPTGKVPKMYVTKGKFVGSAFELCLRAAITRIQFPPFEGKTQSISYTFRVKK